MIEEGFFNNNISKTIINSYLSKPKLKKIDALILACTHYPLIHKEISNYYNDSIEILDSADIAAQAVLKALTSAKLLASKNKTVNHFYVSDYTKSFESSTKIFFKGKLQLEKFGLWDND
jgi:glutamate racemase